MQIYRDMWQRRQYSEVNVLDAQKYGYSQYLLEGKLSKVNNKTRYILPINVDDNIDLIKYV